MSKYNYTAKTARFFRVFLGIAAALVMVFPVLPAASAETLEGDRIIVSLGDSYSSGEGIEPFYGQNEDTSKKVKNPDWLAHRSQNSWSGMLTLPSVSGTMSENRNTHWYFAAVSGAETEHMLHTQKKEYDRDGNSGTASLDPQLDVFDTLGSKKADYVTITLGGNDAGFTDVITEAALGSTYLHTSKLSDKLNDTWKKFYADGGIRDDLRQAYEAISKKAGPQAKILVAGYPKLLDQTGKGFFFSREEATLVNDSVSNFNNEIENLVNACKASGIKICFVSVEEAFNGHEAYSDNPYINKVMLPQSEDLTGFPKSFVSAYSMHPNSKGAKAYAKCVQSKIDQLEADGGESEWMVRTTSDERDIVLVLDASGSMAGAPMKETKKASANFIRTVLKEDASIGIVTYDNDSMMLSDFNLNESYLTSVVQQINDGGGTNIESGLSMARDMLQNSNAKKKIIVLMSDGEPNDGKVGDELISYADEIKKDGIYIYTLGFFENMGGYRSSAQALMEGIASSGCHYEVADANDLVFFFGDIADQLNGQKYIYVRIACPVDVTVSHDGEMLNSSEENLCVRTDFGTLTFEENEDRSDDRTKILRLKEGASYDIRIQGTDSGEMDYTIGFMDENGEYSDIREFYNIVITQDTVIDTVAKNARSTELKVDQNGDGKYDIKYRAKENGTGEVVDYTYLYYIVGGAVAFILFAVVVIAVKRSAKTRKS
ncbi:VWA domain-containing protein [Christensenella sp. MSJ-20]|uniref:VWA domain-containing protein n=1 Tax=Christensenella sp. MSJ-20 TaxID=2841518 RepID=UPI001C74B425|nr:VWA domain-containing protein [Christensenella sp. MSJ-20]